MATDAIPLLRQPLYGRSEVVDREESPPLSPELCTQPVPRALAGVIVYVEVRSIDSRENRSSAIASELEALGATASPRFTKDVTHVVFKDGKPTVRERAEKNRVFLVSPLWVEACKRANDWISEAKYPVITRDATDPNSTPVVLGKIKRIKSMQPKPLEEEIAKSRERSRKRPARGEGREGEKRRREIVEESSNEMEEGGESDFELPVINLPHTPRLPLSEKATNAEVTPYLAFSNSTVNKQTNNNSKQPQHNRKQTENENDRRSEGVSETSDEDDDFIEGAGSKVVSKGNKAKSAGSKVVAKSTKILKVKLAKSRGGAMATKHIVAGQHSKAGRRSKKALTKSVNVTKKAEARETSETPPTSKEPSTAVDPTTEPAATDREKEASLGRKKKRRSNNSRPFTRELPGLVMTSVCREDQELVLSVVGKLGRFSITDTVEEQTTHLVCGQPKRTINVLSATVRGCWVLSIDWVWQSLEAGKWLAEEEFEMIENFPASHYFRQERAEAGRLFKSTLFKEAGSVYVSPSSSPPALQLEMLLVAGGAHLTRSMRKADVCVGCHSPREGLEEGGAVCVTEIWILDSISSHRMLSCESYDLGRPQSSGDTSPEL